MATQRTAAPMSAFFKFTKIGQKIAGRIHQYRTNDQGGFVILRPAILRDSRSDTFHAYESAAVGLATDLKLKITQRDEGKYISVEWTDQEPTKKGSPRKIFDVLELSGDEMKTLAAGADMSHRTELYRGRDGDANAAGDQTIPDDDDLPF
jgi:hypothetical protein